MYRVLYHDAYAAYYRLCREYNLAIARLDSTVALLKEAFSTNYVNQLSTKADILVEARRSQKALPIYQEVLQMKDSLITSLSNKQMELIQKDYHIDKVILEEELLKNKIQTTALITITTALMILFFFMIRAYSVRRALIKAENVNASPD